MQVYDMIFPSFIKTAQMMSNANEIPVELKGITRIGYVMYSNIAAKVLTKILQQSKQLTSSHMAKKTIKSKPFEEMENLKQRKGIVQSLQYFYSMCDKEQFLQELRQMNWSNELVNFYQNYSLLIYEQSLKFLVLLHVIVKMTIHSILFCSACYRLPK